MDAHTHFQVLEAHRTINNCPVSVTPTRRLLLKSRMIKVDLDDLTATSDVRTYLLYNDQLIFCKKDNSKFTLQYKGEVNLLFCDLRVLSPALGAKMVQAKRSLLSSFRSNTNTKKLPSAETPAFGFELLLSDNTMDMTPSHFENATSTSTPLKRRHIIRTQSLEEQSIWVEQLAKVIQHVKWTHLNPS